MKNKIEINIMKFTPEEQKEVNKMVQGLVENLNKNTAPIKPNYTDADRKKIQDMGNSLVGNLNKNTQSKWAIVIDKIGGEFYPDPIYTDIPKLDAKLIYLQDPKWKSKKVYIAELLTPEREAQHDKEWKQWVGGID